jgi:nucleotide-binding universal stress UspA family protein
MYASTTADLELMDASALAVVERVVEAAGEPPAGVQVSSEAIRGSGAFGLIEESRDSDLVVVGSRGRGGFKGLVLGSTSATLAAHSHCPVAIVR